MTAPSTTADAGSLLPELLQLRREKTQWTIERKIFEFRVEKLERQLWARKSEDQKRGQVIDGGGWCERAAIVGEWRWVGRSRRVMAVRVGAECRQVAAGEVVSPVGGESLGTRALWTQLRPWGLG